VNIGGLYIGEPSEAVTQERIITVSGTTVACINATSLIIAKLAEDPDGNKVVPHNRSANP
jgi:hypothetical protein